MPATPTRKRLPSGGNRDDGQPEPDMGRRIRLWERKLKLTYGRAAGVSHWHPITWHEVLAGLGGNLDRTAARLVEAMALHGQTVETLGAYFRFRSEAERRQECTNR